MKLFQLLCIFFFFSFSFAYGLPSKPVAKNLFSPKVSVKNSYFSDSTGTALEGNILLPLSTGKHTFFSEFHGIQHLQGRQSEINTVLGYRYLINSRTLAGIFVSLDRNVTGFGSTFYQATLGGEWWHGLFTGRTNLYVPLSSERHVSVQSIGIHWVPLENGTEIGTPYVNKVHEKPLYGTDIMIGRYIGNMYLAGGGYFFGAKQYDSIYGPKLKATYAWNSILSPVVHYANTLSLETELSYDTVRGMRLYGGIRISVGGNKTLSNINTHRTDFVQRDIDIVTHIRQEKVDYNQTTNKHVTYVYSDTPPVCKEGQTWVVHGTVTLTQTYTACAGSSIMGESSNATLSYKGHNYSVDLRDENSLFESTIQADPTLNNDLIVLQGGSSQYTQNITTLNLIQRNNGYAYHTISLENDIKMHNFYTVKVSDVYSDGRMQFLLPHLSPGITLHLDDIVLEKTTSDPVTQTTTVYTVNGAAETYAAGLLEILNTNTFINSPTFTVSTSYITIIRSHGLSGVLISGSNTISNNSIKFTQPIHIQRFFSASVFITKNGVHTPVLLYMGENTIASEVFLPNSLTLDNAYGLINNTSSAFTVNVDELVSENSKYYTLTHSTLIKNNGTIDSLLFNDNTLLSLGLDSQILVNNHTIHTLRMLNNTTYTGAVLPVGGIIKNLGTIDTMDVASVVVGSNVTGTVISNPFGTIGHLSLWVYPKNTNLLNVTMLDNTYGTISQLSYNVYITGNITQAFTTEELRPIDLQLKNATIDDYSIRIHNATIKLINDNTPLIDFNASLVNSYPSELPVFIDNLAFTSTTAPLIKVESNVTLSQLSITDPTTIVYNSSPTTVGFIENYGTITDLTFHGRKNAVDFISYNETPSIIFNANTGNIHSMNFNNVDTSGMVLLNTQGNIDSVTIDNSVAPDGWVSMTPAIRVGGGYIKTFIVNNLVMANGSNRYINYFLDMTGGTIDQLTMSGISMQAGYNYVLNLHGNSAVINHATISNVTTLANPDHDTIRTLVTLSDGSTIRILKLNNVTLNDNKDIGVKINVGSTINSLSMDKTTLQNQATGVLNYGHIGFLTMTQSIVSNGGICLVNHGIITHFSLDSGCNL